MKTYKIYDALILKKKEIDENFLDQKKAEEKEKHKK